jgi:hypothetical protein
MCNFGGPSCVCVFVYTVSQFGLTWVWIIAVYRFHFVTIAQLLADVPSGLSLTPPHETKLN